jgi:hypothetical protein
MSGGGATKGRRGHHPRPSPRINAVRKLDFQNAAGLYEIRREETRAPVLKARQVQNPRSYEEMLAHAKKRFSKTIAYLAR